MGLIKNKLSNLKEADLYSVILFALAKIRDIPEYSSLSELCYVLDKENLLKLCEYFGGSTIKIPTIYELESLVYALLLYQHVNIDGKDYEEAVKVIGLDSKEMREVKANYSKLSDILSTYSFNLGR